MNQNKAITGIIEKKMLQLANEKGFNPKNMEDQSGNNTRIQVFVKDV